MSRLFILMLDADGSAQQPHESASVSTIWISRRSKLRPGVTD
jgi:hypothetical protein